LSDNPIENYKSSNKNTLTNTRRTRRGSLTIVGSGIQAVRQFTLESKQAIEQADKVLYLVTDPISEMWIEKMNPNSESLMHYYTQGKSRFDTYKEMTANILKYVREGLNVCAIFYGHPGVFVAPSREAIKIAQNEGFDAHMLPGISAEDCLFADLGVDPYTHGCQSFEATNFLLRRRKFDTSSHLIIWQIGSIGDMTHNPSRDNKPTLAILADFLQKYYGSNHEVFVYQAAEYAICKPIIQRLSIARLTEAYIHYGTTLYVPPKTSDIPPVDYGMANRVGLSDQLKPIDVRFSVKKLFHLRSDK
jgi:uncharacterized protein YabN with tetrapyrrole methylase and pyrophosphatase domain